MAMYRGQTTTMQKIQAVSSLRITTREEAIAFLRAIADVNNQIAAILQRQNMQELAVKNSTPPVVKEAEEVQEVEPVVEAPAEEAPFEEEEGHTEEQKRSLLDKLRKANK